MPILIKQIQGRFDENDIDGIGMTLEHHFDLAGRRLQVVWNETSNQFQITAYKDTSTGQADHELEPDKTDRSVVSQIINEMPVMKRCFEIVGP